MSLFDHGPRLFMAAGLLALGGAIIGGGCGGGGFNSIQDFCAELAAHDCTQPVVMACYGASDATLDMDTKACISARTSLLKCNPDMLPFHGEFADACISAHDDAFSQTTIDIMTWQALETACMAVFNNGGTMGSNCTTDVDCDVGNGYACVVHGPKGACQIPTIVAAGEDCTDPTAKCDVGLYCDTGGHCVAEPVQNGICSDVVPCASGFYCDAQAKVCEQTLPDLSKCAKDSECQGGFCLTGKCASTYTIAFGASTCSDFTTGL